MFTELVVPFVDTSAAQLSHSLDVEPLDALCELTVDSRQLGMRMRVLGTSHQVVVDDAECGTPLLIETVACGAHPGTELPHEIERDVAGIGYRFESHTRTLDPRQFSSCVARLQRDLSCDSEGGIVARFPGVAGALTAVFRRRDVLGWRTWHCYPNTGEIVSTVTEVTP